MQPEAILTPKDLLHIWLERLSWLGLMLFPVFLATTRAGMDITLSCIAIFFLMRSFLVRDFSWLFRPDILLIVMLWAYFTLSAWLRWLPGGDPVFATCWIRFIIFYASIRQWLLISHERLRLYSGWLFIVLVLVTIDTYVQYITGISLTGNHMQEYRLTGPLSHLNIGNYLLKLILPALGVWLFYAISRHNMPRLFMFLGFAVTVATLIPLTGERSITLLLVVALLVIAVCSFVKIHTYRKWVLTGLTLVAVISAILALTQPVVGLRFTMLEEHLQTFWHTPYGQLFHGAYLLWKENPLLGVGYSQYYRACLPFAQQGLLAYCDIHSHNMYLQWMVETGAIGLLLFGMFATLLLRGWYLVYRYVQPPARAIPVIFAGASLIVCLFPVMVTQSVFSNWSAGLLWYSLALSMAVLSLFAQKESDT